MRVSTPRARWIMPAIIVICVTLRPYDSSARLYEEKKSGKGGIGGPQRVLVLDGTSVHNVGELQMHLLNWGEWGSRPDTGEPYSFAPSAQWPAGSGIEYLFSAGLWVGALRRGLPAVSTAAFENELRPSGDPRDIVYRTKEGAEGGHRPPSPRADDDLDGLVDEDRLDGFDNDGDGAIDEDFGAVSRLMFTCKYTDYNPVSKQIYPQHNPLGIAIYQESYQWDDDRFDDFVAVEYHITNVGGDYLESIYIGMFVDGDAGPRDKGRYWEDDLTARRRIGSVCTDAGAVELDLAYTFDADGDDGQTPGYFGVMFFERQLTTYANFSGRQSFGLGGDPVNDFERYELLSQRTIEKDATLPRDYRMLAATGPFNFLPPGETLVVQAAFVIGEGIEGLAANAANAAIVQKGAWFDLDNDPLTGTQGREHPNYGPSEGVFVDVCRQQLKVGSGCDTQRLSQDFNKPTPPFGEGEVVWSNADCNQECLFRATCGYTEDDSLMFRTGVAGRESHIYWHIATAPPPPPLRVNDHARQGVVIYWDNVSETVPDSKTQRLDFEGYRVWRADNWKRTFGTSVTTGPPSDIWRIILQMDEINDLGDDTGLAAYRYEPLTHQFSPAQLRDLIEPMKVYLQDHPNESPPCPTGISEAVCDTLEALARRELGIEGGREYYRYVDESVHLGAPYFYAVVAFDHDFDERGRMIEGASGDPAANFVYIEPKSASPAAYEYDPDQIYVVPNPVTSESLAPWRLGPVNEDPSGVKVEFRNLPQTQGTVRIYTLAGDLVKEIYFDARAGNGTVTWDLVSRNGQEVTSGIYLYSIEFQDNRFKRVVKKFTVIR